SPSWRRRSPVSSCSQCSVHRPSCTRHASKAPTRTRRPVGSRPRNGPVWVPESFKVLVKELQSLGLAVEVLNEEEEEVTFAEDVDGSDVRSLDINLSGFERGDIE